VTYVRKTIDELAPRFGGVVRLARKDLGITAFGCQVFELPPNVAAHRHSESACTLIHVAPEAVRQPRAGTDGLTYLCVGASPEPTFRPNNKFD